VLSASINDFISDHKQATIFGFHPLSLPPLTAIAFEGVIGHQSVVGGGPLNFD